MNTITYVSEKMTPREIVAEMFRVYAAWMAVEDRHLRTHYATMAKCYRKRLWDRHASEKV